MDGVDTSHPDSQHGDLNLALRGYSPTDASLDLVDLGSVGADPPQMKGLFADGRTPVITAAYRVKDWDWSCGENGCAKDNFVDSYDVSMIGVASNAGETVRFPSNASEIYGGGYIAVVLYADEGLITIAYTRDGSVAGGYTVHLLGLCVDPNLLAMYRAANAAGRNELPGLHSGDAVGVAASNELDVVIRDRGTFLDPRSRGDWWR